MKPDASASPETRLQWAVQTCLKAGIRLTDARRAILKFVAQQNAPVSLDQIAHAPQLAGQCDVTTVYRSVMLLKEAGVLRPIGSCGKASYFVLNAPGEPVGYLICRECGCIDTIRMPELAARNLTGIVQDHGFSAPGLVFEFHGLCAACARAERGRPPVVKLAVTPSRSARV